MKILYLSHEKVLTNKIEGAIIQNVKRNCFTKVKIMAKLKLYDFVKYGKLFEEYSALLSEDRQGIMRLYFDYNMTLAEISAERGISRQAVKDAITKSCEKLDYYENNLKNCQKKEKILKKLEKIRDLNKISEIKLKVEEIIGEI